jgi:hypothetical protein
MAGVVVLAVPDNSELTAETELMFSNPVDLGQRPVDLKA